MSSLSLSPKVRVERRALQIVVAVGSAVPILAGLTGALRGASGIDSRVIVPADFDAHFRYLSGLLLGIGIAYLTAVPSIEQRRPRFLLLGSIVALGGFARLLSILSSGAASPATIAALVMELVVTPLITYWAVRVAGAQ